MSTSIKVEPYTAWNLLDYIITQLGIEGDRICGNRASEDRLYNALVDLVCKSDIKELPVYFVVNKPFYPYILLAYYVLFHKSNLELATTLYNKLLKRYVSNPRAFDRDEEVSLKTLGEVIESFNALRRLDRNKHAKDLDLHVEVLVTKLGSTRCIDESSWSCLFRDLVISALEPDADAAYGRLQLIEERCRPSTRLADEELIEGYNLFIEEGFSPIREFMRGIAERELERLESEREEIREKKRKEEEIKNRLDEIRRCQRKLKIYIEKAETLNKLVSYWPLLVSIIGSAATGFTLAALHLIEDLLSIGIISLLSFSPLSLLYIVLKLYERKKLRDLRRIENMISQLRSSRIRRLAEIIWSSNKPHNISNPA